MSQELHAPQMLFNQQWTVVRFIFQLLLTSSILSEDHIVSE